MTVASSAIAFEVRQCAALTADVVQVRLIPSLAKAPRYRAGQYLKVQLPDGTLRALSIASPPEAEHIELQVRVSPDRPASQVLLGHFRPGTTITCQLPFGNCCLPEDPRPVVMIAGGTGISPMRAMITSSIARGESREIWLYWGATSHEALFLDAELRALAAAHPRLHYRPVVEQASSSWPGAIGLPHLVAKREHPSFASLSVFCSGSVAMARAVYRTLQAYGLPFEQFHCDWIEIFRARNEPF